MDANVKKQLLLDAVKIRKGIIEGTFFQSQMYLRIFTDANCKLMLLLPKQKTETDLFFQKVMQHLLFTQRLQMQVSSLWRTLKLSERAVHIFRDIPT